MNVNDLWHGGPRREFPVETIRQQIQETKSLIRHFMVLLSLFVVLSPRTIQAEDSSNTNDASNKSVDYLTDIKPLLRDKCFSCHGSLKQEGGLRLDAASLIQKGGESGPTYAVGSVANSLILERVTDEDDNRMPPAEDGSRLTVEEVAKLTAWIKSGAAAPDEAIPEHPSRHWSFLPPVKADVPSISADWIHSDIDRFLAAEHQRVGVTAVGKTSRSMLLRRASLALTGLPPTPTERQAFLDDNAEAAFENAIDRLLQSPRYGERWARHFMDIWRYSDPSGYGKEIRDGRNHIWRWRDWIVESLNEDKGYDRMIVEMLAADEASPEDQASLRATGFLARNWYKFNRNVWLDNIVEHSSKAFLGLTVNCARCHDHKYDPIEQAGYYRMRAIFETHDVRDDPLQLTSAGSANEMLVRTYDAHLDRKTFTFLQGNEDRPTKDPLLPGLPGLFGGLSVDPVAFPVTTWYPSLRKENRDAALKTARADIAAAEAGLRNSHAALAASRKKLAEFKEPKPTPGAPSNKTIAKTTARTGTPVLSDDFSKLNADQWKVEGGMWSAKDGRVVQSTGTTKQHRLVSLIEHPRDFRAKLRLRITGGETYKSVGLGFDGHGLAMNSVYLSASGAKVQFTSQGSGGRWQYPASGAASHSTKVGQDYLLEVAVKDQLMNVLIDGELKVAYNLPKRKAGQISIWAFSATAEFDQLDVTTLPPETQLEPVAGSSTAPPKLLTKKDLQLALKVAEASEKIAIAHRQATQSAVASLEARIAADTVKYGLAEGDAGALAVIAGRASRQHAVDQLSEQLAEARLKTEQARQKQETSAAARAKATSERQAAEKQIADVQKKLTAAKEQLDSGSKQYAAIGPQYPKSSSGRRLAFARWITDRGNPLAARVLVNHVWLRHFDTPLLERAFDFGLRSERPRHVVLLDWLAVQFMEDGWSLKKLHKQIIMSGVYRLSSSSSGASGATLTADPDNHALWRMNARRMEAEVVRDSVLSLGGCLELTTGGPPIEHTQGQKVLRRSLYFRQNKEQQMTFLSLFDGAKVNECYQRKSTVAPQQALAMFNSHIAAGQAQNIAEIYSTLDSSDLVDAMFEHVLCRKPNAEELAECTQFLTEVNGSAEARRQLALVLLNHNDFVTIR
jgi:hypothetical protein